MKYKQLRLGDLAEFTTGKLNANKAVEDGKYPFFTTSPETLRINNFAFDQDAILLGGNNANGVFQLKRYTGKFNAYQRTYVISVVKENIINNDYLYYALMPKLVELQNKSLGTATKFITKRILENLLIKVPNNYNEMERRATYLRTIDNKIQLNKQLNANLYEQIKTISNSHFSYFDFSDGHIPSNWHYTSLSDVAEITTGYSYTSRELHSSKTAMATIKNFERTGGFSDKGYKEIIPQKKLKDSKMARKFDILVAHTDLTQNADIIGNAEIILDTSIYSQLIYSMDLVRVRTKATNVSQFLLSLILQGDRLKKHCLGYVNGTTVLHLSKKALKEFYIPLPNDLHELDHISKFAKAAYMNIAINIQENSMLQEAKQTLLRKFF